MRIDVTYGFHCSADGCDVTEVDHRSDIPEHRIPSPRLPQGWLEVGLLLFCPRHTIMLQVDDHTQELATEEG
jgi:hypothetical protein